MILRIMQVLGLGLVFVWLDIKNFKLINSSNELIIINLIFYVCSFVVWFIIFEFLIWEEKRGKKK